MEEGELSEALQAVDCMDQQRIFVSTDIFSSLLQRCINKDYLEVGRQLNILILRRGMKLFSFLGSHLIRMFALCGSLSDANQVFSRLPKPNVFAWSAIITAHAKYGQDDQAINLFHQMQESSVNPDGHVLVAVLKACTTKMDLKQGRLIHAEISRNGNKSNPFVGSSLIYMYSKCGSLEDAHKVLDELSERNVVTWSALIAGYAQQGHGQEALHLFQQMQWERIEPDCVTFVSVLKSCSDITDVEQGKLIHSYINEYGFESHMNVANALLNMYSKCGSLEDARKHFDGLESRDVVTYSAMISGYAQHEQGEKALVLFQQMQMEGLQPNQVTFVCLLQACSGLSSLDQGRLIHGHIFESGCDLNIFICNALIDMYIKCGSPEEAYRVFIALPKRDMVTWNAMIAEYVQHSDFKLAKEVYEGMQQQGLTLNDITFVCLLGACSHMGVVKEGCDLFRSMRDEHSIAPTLEHYGCMVDLLGRAGCLNEAEDLLLTMPFQPNMAMWMSLLCHCSVHGNVDIGSQCFDCVIIGDHRHAASYVIMSNIYASANMWEDAGKVLQLRSCANAWKKPGAACIEFEEEVHDFVVADKSNMQKDAIYAELRRLRMRMKEEGYVT